MVNTSIDCRQQRLLSLAIRSSHLEEQIALRTTVLSTVALHYGGAGGHVHHDLVQRRGERGLTHALLLLVVSI